MTALRIMLVADLLAPAVGGTEAHVETLAQLLAARGHEVEVVTQLLPGSLPEERHGDVRIRRLEGWSRALARFYRDPRYRFLPPAPDPGLARAFRAEARAFRPDVVHGHGLTAYSLAAAGLASPLVITLHDHWATCARRIFTRDGARCSGPGLRRCLTCAGEQYGQPKASAIVLAQRASARLLRRVDRFVAVSSSVRDALRLVGEYPVEIVPNFVDAAMVEASAALPRPAWLPAGEPLLFIGALTRDKGADVLLDAYARLPQDAPPLVIVGGRRPDVALPDDPRIVVVPGVARAEILRAWHDAYVGLVPSTVQDACPTVAIEALLAGVPVIGTRVGGVPDIIADGENGLLVPHGDAAALAAAIGSLTDDRARRDALAARAAETGRDFSAQAVVPRIEAVYADVLERAAA